MLYEVTFPTFNPCQKPEHSAGFVWGMFGYLADLLVDNLVDNLLVCAVCAYCTQ
jgi:hypothetical protein